MTEANRKENIREELGRSAGALGAADLLYANGYLHEAVSRLYYFLLYTVRAALLSKGLEARGHEGTLRLFAQSFVKSGSFAAESAHIFAKLMKYREEADYNPSYSFVPEDFQRLRQEAGALADAVKEYLQAEGYL